MSSSNGVSSQIPELNRDNPAASKQTSHVRACTNCVRARSKCSIGGNTKGRCERYGFIFI